MVKLKRYIFPLIITVTLLFQKYYCISAEEIIDPYSDLEYNNICLNLTNNMVDEFTINISVPEKHTLSKFIVDTFTTGNVSFDEKPLDINAKCVKFIDLNADSYPEMVIGTYKQNYLLINNKNGTFLKRDEFGTSYTQDMCLRDYDNDDDIDLILANMSGPSYIYENLGNFEFQPHKVIDDGTHAYNVDCADVDLDGDLDFAFANGICGPVESTKNILLVNNGNNDFSCLYRFGCENTIVIKCLHLNNDQYPDICVVNEGSFQFFINNKDLTFSEMIIDQKVQYNVSTSGTYGIRSKDFDNDGDLDIYIHCGEEYFYFENINFSFFYRENITYNYNYFSIDINNDNELDKFYYDYNGVYLDLKINGSYKKIVLDNRKTKWRGFTSADFDNDNDIDIIIYELFNTYILTNNQYRKDELDLTDLVNKCLVNMSKPSTMYLNILFSKRTLLNMGNLTIEFQPDNDYDSIPNNIDNDDDNDGYLDEWEAQLNSDPLDPNDQPKDTDKDGIPDGDHNNTKPWMDLDDDNDGFNDSLELKVGSDPKNNNDYPSNHDNDEIIDFFDDDDDNDGYNDTLELEIGTDPFDNQSYPLDHDDDGILDYFDNDDDNDGYNDGLEKKFNTDPFDNSSFPLDHDRDGTLDSSDPDDDNDGYIDTLELEIGTNPFDNLSFPMDYDNDNIIDFFDDDDDNDGYIDIIEFNEGTNSTDKNSKPNDLDNDLIPDSIDNDLDGDGYNNTVDKFPNNPNEWEDYDKDGLGDNKEDPYPNDLDNDGHPDSEDQYPNDPDKWKIEKTEKDFQFDLLYIILITIIIIILILILLFIYTNKEKK